MNIFENFLMILLLIIFPIYLYFFYIAYNQNIEKKENQLFYLFTMITSYYLLSKYLPSSSNVYIFSLDILLLLTYLKKQNTCILLITVLNIFFYYNTYNFSLFLLLIEYTLYALIYKISKQNRSTFFFFFLLIKTLFIFLFQDKQLMTYFSVYFMSYICYIAYELGEEIMRYHHSIKDMEKDKSLYKSLFQITHEIKNPIAVCKGYLDMYDDQKIETHKYVPIVKSEIERTLVLLEDFLSIHHLKITKEEMDANMLLEDIMDHFNFICREKNIHLKIDECNEEIYIKADYNRLFQVLMNMVKNSIEALREKEEGNIYIALKETTESIYIVIEDDGEGMDQQTLDRVKEPFFSTKSNGTGLGVCLSSQIIEAHGGLLFYESSKEDGTKVTIQLKKEA